MFFKLSLRNVLRSYRDYTIYFLTLILAVSVFYIFNSLASQGFISEVLQAAPLESIEAVEIVINYLSMFIAVILGFLIIYANSFLIRRRKKELGIYLTLGMDRRQISRILLIETLIIGLLSLMIGIGIGVPLSQIFGVMVFRFMDVYLHELTFIFSPEVVGRTILYFGIMFLAVILVNILSVSRYKIITLIEAQKKSQKLGISSGWISFIIFFIGVGLLGRAYGQVLNEEAFQYIFLEMNILPVFIQGVIGTFFLFFSFAGFLVVVMKRCRCFYYQNINPFVFRQISRRIHLNWLSLSFICLMITVSISAIGVGRGFVELYSHLIDEVEKPFDVTISAFSKEMIEEEFQEAGLELDEFTPGIDVNQIIGSLDLSQFTNEIHVLRGFETGVLLSDLFIDEIDFVLNGFSLSEVNQILAEQGLPSLELEENELIIVSNHEELHLENLTGEPIFFNGNEFRVNHIIKAELFTSGQEFTTQLVFPDQALAELESNFTFHSFNYHGSFLDYERDFMAFMNEANEELLSELLVLVHTKNMLQVNVNLLSILVTFISFYIATIFILVSMILLALQQLIEAVESAEKYDILTKLGVEEKVRNKGIFTQIALYFFVPFGIASIHSFVALTFFIRILEEEILWEVRTSSLMWVSFLLVSVIYGLYFVATYWQYKRMVQSQT